MKKTMLSAAVLTGLFAFGASANPASGDIDDTSATLTWEAKVPTVVTGKALTNAGLTIDADGSFTSDAVTVEVRYWDSETGVAGEPVVVGTETAASSGVVPSSITYRVDSPSFSSEKGTDLSTVDVSIFKDDKVVAPNTALVETADSSWQTRWKLASAPGKGISNVVAGDVITATTILRADVAFADK
ncbi:hypothetical protein [Vibrio hyugaensis]|uniref:hypothetical protein n=1 Tax=Vibrio hyugaensis TaxID=1534743 RepID=UPI0005EE8713|nr:hypothetical protein [Vibrio hyugaensis]